MTNLNKIKSDGAIIQEAIENRPNAEPVSVISDTAKRLSNGTGVIADDKLGDVSKKLDLKTVEQETKLAATMQLNGIAGDPKEMIAKFGSPEAAMKIICDATSSNPEARQRAAAHGVVATTAPDADKTVAEKTSGAPVPGNVEANTEAAKKAQEEQKAKDAGPTKDPSADKAPEVEKKPDPLANTEAPKPAAKEPDPPIENERLGTEGLGSYEDHNNGGAFNEIKADSALASVTEDAPAPTGTSPKVDSVAKQVMSTSQSNAATKKAYGYSGPE